MGPTGSRVGTSNVTSRFQVYVVPRSSKPGPDGRHDGLPRIRVKSPPTGGRANEEAERALGELLATRVTLVAGAGSRRKTFEAAQPKAVLQARIRSIFGD
jgi:uncharacterized protein YggU (UPF0235/DUF167 family)